ncbi:hypothetical protein PCASD_20652 [Puccinia coronata f. sp. avenae]|uniref:Uncharacterized protein n=1 Tax=Puccinia coronata f. sp. avenae TaxID=200324 RepID=A0A2N5UDH1_9BASI|nr:hypothetical protein PCASD_20652 [Puccinia coronata f. sp. avenae]
MPNPAPTEIGWVGDASTTFGIGILIGNQWAQFQLRRVYKPDSPLEKLCISRLETIAVQLGILMLEKLGIKEGKTFIVWTDNTTTKGAIRKRKSRDETVNKEWKRIQALMVKLQMDIVGRRVTSKENCADALLRGMSVDPGKIPAFLSNGSVKKELLPQDLYFLKGYKGNTLTAVKKFVRFMEEKGEKTFALPISADQVFGAKYPEDVEQRVKVLLHASAKANVLGPPKEMKKAVHLKHLVHLAITLSGGSPKEKAVFNLAIVAFWGMAQLGELTPCAKGKVDPRTLVRKKDVTWVGSGSEMEATLTLQDAETYLPGETQTLHLRLMHNLVCPIEAVKRRVIVCKAPQVVLFGFTDNKGEATNLTKDLVTWTLKDAWSKGSFKDITSHSFQVGGASFQSAMGISTKEIFFLGQWVSNCYQLYICEYTKEEMDDSTALLAELDACWELPNRETSDQSQTATLGGNDTWK